MYNKTKPNKTKMKFNKSYEGETIEMKVRRIMANKEPITDGAPMIYTERADGIQPAYNIRTDRWEVAVDAMNYVDKTMKAKREERHKTEEQKEAERIAKEAKEGMEKESGAQSIQGTQHKLI